MAQYSDGAFSFEIFAAKDLSLMMMTVPCRCGLNQADTLHIKDLNIFAMQNDSILPIDFPTLTENCYQILRLWSNKNKKLAVGEFTARGLLNCYFLKLALE